MPQQRRKVLVLAPRLPYPVIGGDRVRIYGLCVILAKHFDLTLLSLCESEEEMRMDLPADGVFRRVERVRLTKNQSYLNCLLALPTGRPLQVAYYRSREFAARIAELLPEHDAVFAHLIRTGDYVRHVKCPKVLEMTDATALKYERIMACGAELKWMFPVYLVESRRLKTYERSIVKYFDTTVLVSDVDKDFLLDRGGVDGSGLLRCCNGFNPELPYQFSPDGCTIVFIGNIASLQNLDAARYFAHDVFPLIRKQRPDAVFRIIGKIDDLDAIYFRTIDGVQVTGEISSVAQAAMGGSVGVCPIRFGAGVQNKMLDYMALGIPAVCSRIGHEGLAAIPGTDLIVADAPADVADACIRLLGDREEAQRLSIAGRRYVETEHDWGENLAPLVEQMYKLLGEAPSNDEPVPQVLLPPS
jgi:glycosyltransferase involved in cell wall biosynthesis